MLHNVSTKQQKQSLAYKELKTKAMVIQLKNKVIKLENNLELEKQKCAKQIEEIKNTCKEKEVENEMLVQECRRLRDMIVKDS